MEGSQSILRCQTPNCSRPIITSGKKRKLSASSNDGDDQPAVKYLELAEVFTLERFSDEVLFEIFKYLKTPAIYALKNTCRRFWGIVQDHRLWKDIDTLEQIQSVDCLRDILKRAHTKTTSIRIAGFHKKPRDDRDDVCLLKHVIPKCEILTDLELQSVFVDFSKIKLQDFPKDLKRLVFRDVTLRWPDNAPTVFQKLDKSLIWLEELGVESCNWFHPYDIMMFSKCPSLKKLSLRGCQNLSDFVPYGSMAARFGFKKLEHLDVRDTPITDSDLQCFNAVLTLKELLLECPMDLRKKQEENKCSLPEFSQSNNFCNFSCNSSSSSSSSCSSANSSLSDSAEGSDNAEDGRPSTSRERNGEPRNPEPANNGILSIELATPARMRLICGLGAFNPDARNRNPDNPQGSFWDMIYRQTGAERRHYMPQKPQISPISNRGISCFGRPQNPVDLNIIWIRIGDRPNNNSFEKLVVKYYKRVTDDSLLHLAQCSPNLVYLDVTGTGVTQSGIEEFKTKKPECVVVYEDTDD